MPGPLLNVQIVASCPHAGTVAIVPIQQRVKVNGVPAATVADAFPVTSCTLTGTAPPCLSVLWTAPAQRVKVMGSPVLLASSQGTGLPTPPGAIPPIPSPTPAPPTPRSITIVSTQTRVRGT